MDGIYSRMAPLEQPRWNQSNIDTLFYAGSQQYINRTLGSNMSNAQQQYYFNICQQPVNMVTGKQRQNRKSITYFPSENSDPQTTDQYTQLILESNNANGVNEQYSKACELSAVSGMVLTQPYLDFTGDDPAQGDLKLKIWEYNSFMVDPFFRMPDMSDCQTIWCQEYLSREKAIEKFGRKAEMMPLSSNSPQGMGTFYFLPENYYMMRNGLMIVSYIYYKWRTTKKRLYSKKLNQFFDFSQKDESIHNLLRSIPDLEVVNVTVPTWKLAVILNDQLMYQGDNPYGIDTKCPFVPIFWNYEPHVNDPNLRVRSLIRPMRDPQYLFNHKVITNNDIASATINAGWKRKIGAVANEDNLKKAGQGYDIIINQGYELQDCEKIIPSAVPESDLALAEQMKELMFATSGFNMENWSGQQDQQISTTTMIMKQAANLMVFQKYFDQWDYALKLIGDLELQIVLNNWSPEKVHLMIGEQPTELFYSKIFAKYKVIVEEGLYTPTQKSFQAQQMMEINQIFGREVFSPSMIIKDMNLQGKSDIMQYLEQQEQAASVQQEQMQMVQHSIEEAKLKEIYSKSAANIAMARERNGRMESNLGLFEERLSAIEKNRALTLKEKMQALTSLLENVSRFGEIETALQQQNLDTLDYESMLQEDLEKNEVHQRTEANKFLSEIMKNMPSQEVANYS